MEGKAGDGWRCLERGNGWRRVEAEAAAERVAVSWSWSVTEGTRGGHREESRPRQQWLSVPCGQHMQPLRQVPPHYISRAQHARTPTTTPGSGALATFC